MAPSPTPEAPGQVTPLVAAAPEAPQAPAPAPVASPVAAAPEVVLSGLVNAPADLRAPGAPRALSAVGDRPLANAPVRILDPITKKTLGNGVTDAQGRYRITLGVGLAPDGKTLQVTVGAIAPNGEVIELSSLTRVPGKTPGAAAQTDLEVPVSLGTSLLLGHMLANGGLEAVDEFVLADFLTAVGKLETALRSDEFDAADLSDPTAVSKALASFAQGDTSLGDLLKDLGDGTLPALPKSGGGGSSSNNDPEDPDPSEERNPIFSGSIQ